MNKLIFSLLIVAGVLVSLNNCSPKTTKTTTTPVTTTTTTVEEPFAKKSMDQQSMILATASQQQLSNGITIYKSHCGKCHKLHEPNSRNFESWMKVMKSMGPKAKLVESEYIDVCAYLKTAAKQ